MGIVIVLNHIPVNTIPPALEVLVLSGDTVVHHPSVLPGVDAQNGLDIEASRRKVSRVFGVAAHESGEPGLGSGHVVGLAASVGGWVGRAGAVCAEDVQHAFALEVLGEPHKARTEHGACCCKEIHLEGVDGGRGVCDVLGKLCGDGGGCGGLCCGERSQS